MVSMGVMRRMGRVLGGGMPRSEHWRFRVVHEVRFGAIEYPVRLQRTSCLLVYPG